MILHAASHIDHVSPIVLDYVLKHFAHSQKFFIATIELPFCEAFCDLYGPICGDYPILESEVDYAVRGNRTWISRVVNRPRRLTNKVTVVAGPYQNHNCILYTVYGGPVAPKEVNDPNLKEEERATSEVFWSLHALAAQGGF